MPDRSDYWRSISLPANGLWRVSRWREPFEPRTPSPPVGEVSAADDTAGRWDSPDGTFRTLYCATEAEGALGEKLGEFALRPAAVRRIEAFLESEPDEEYVGDTLAVRVDAEDIESFGWQLACAPATAYTSAIDITHPRTFVAVFHQVLALLPKYGLKAFDRSALLETQRGFTRELAGVYRAAATALDGTLLARGLRYESRLPPSWECWALWEPLPIDKDSQTGERVSIDTPALRAAAAQLGVVLGD